MLVSNVIEDARYGELKNISVTDEAVASYINLAVLALYDRFRLKTSEQVIEMVEGQTMYDLQESTMTVLSVFNHEGDEYIINDVANENSVFLPSYDTIQVANPCVGTAIYVINTEAPERINIETISFKLPPQLLEPLLHYVGYRAHGAIDGNINAENNTHLMRYEASCRRIEVSGTIRKDVVRASVSRQEHIAETAKLNDRLIL
jgi:hypothetical protein